MLPDLLAALAARLAAEPDVRRWVIAFSGGLDSSLLLELCARLQLPQPLIAVHVDHQLQPASADFAEHCRLHCRRLAIPLTQVQVTPASASEASARAARYRAFEQLLEPGDCLLLAQHADDQAETLLLRLLRGAGVAGLAAMPETRPLGQARLVRPLLAQPRARLEQVAAELGLQPVEDPTNAQDHYDRNWLRLRVLPQLLQRWPSLHQRCRDTAALMQDADLLLRERAEEDRRHCQVAAGQLDLDALQALSAPRQRNLMHHWIHAVTGLRLSRTRLLTLVSALMSAAADADPVERLQGYQLRRYRRRVYLLPDPLPPSLNPADVRVGEPLQLPQGRLSWLPAPRGLVPGDRLALAGRAGGERLRPLGRGGSVRLKQLLQEAGVPPWQRPLQPLLYRQQEIVAVPGVCLCEEGWIENGLMPHWDAFGLS
ncbi:tRNA lysidine(34) synthetase TilS [Marinobacterium weihaiense]|uniref:tRNA(Ile)-lysidine synthase n=1 Tax=Marinobacterium weihaiense TaxID=2851016 RepID=A0ABS6M897_9GAMM|nr:tRNA lysidine(34) synthetase TilS [Marinobacterium weihaiense]MBV0932512.1 tRNA lysidine(34) synthetase TilS [Marinobacterium weihaiense]